MIEPWEYANGNVQFERVYYDMFLPPYCGTFHLRKKFFPEFISRYHFSTFPLQGSSQVNASATAALS